MEKAPAVEQLNSLLSGMGMPYRVDVVSPKEIKLLDKNARYMSHETFQNLVGNIKRYGHWSGTLNP